MENDYNKSQNIRDFKNSSIEEIREETKSTRSYFFNIPEGITWDAGSDMHFAFPNFMDNDIPDKTLMRHMSLMTLPDEGKIGFTTRVPGSGSTYKKKLETLEPGDEMVMFKLGNRIPLRREDRSIVLISMGVGVATMRPMILQWLKDSTGIPSMTNLVVDKKEQFIFRNELESITTNNLTHIFCENRNSFNRNLELLQFDENKIFYIVGSESFLDDIIKRLKAKGIRSENIEIDKKPEKKAALLR